MNSALHSIFTMSVIFYYYISFFIAIRGFKLYKKFKFNKLPKKHIEWYGKTSHEIFINGLLGLTLGTWYLFFYNDGQLIRLISLIMDNK